MNEISNSKNIITQAYINAKGDVIVGDITINLKEAAQYKHLQAEIEDLNIRFERTKRRIEKDPADGELQEELLEIDGKRSQKQKEIDTLRQEVLKLAEDFQRIPINTERLRSARQHFESGEFVEARAVLDAEMMGKELDALLQQKGHLQERTAENQQQLTSKANEYLILARLTATDFTLPDPFKKTLLYFEQSLRAERSTENVFAYAYFLNEHKQFSQVQPLYEEVLEMYRQLAEVNPQAYLPNVATTLNNLAALYYTRDEFSLAQPAYEEALQMYRQLAEVNPQAYLPNVATTLWVYGDFFKATENYAQALQLYQESLGIFTRFAEKEPAAWEPKVSILQARCQGMEQIVGSTEEK